MEGRQRVITRSMLEERLPFAANFAPLTRERFSHNPLPNGGEDVAENRFELIGRNAMLSIFTRANPQPVRDPSDVVKILKMAA